MKRIAIITALILILLPALFSNASAEDTVYGQLGNDMPDFSIVTVDGNAFTLSEALKEKDMVLINLWATWCGPCRMEFPALQEAYNAYKDKVEVIALSVDPSDSEDMISSFVAENELTFKVGSVGDLDFLMAFAANGIPTTIAVDRFGVIAFVEVGAQPSASFFTRLFDAFVGDEYTESRVYTELPPLVPTVAAAETDDLNAALNVDGGELVFRNPNGKYDWPMLPVETGDRLALISSNSAQPESRSSVVADVIDPEGGVLAFDFHTSTEAIGDLLCVSVDGKTAKSFGGEHDWTVWAIELSAGEHEIIFSYVKDQAGDFGTDCVMIDNVRLVSGSEADALLAALPVYPVAEETAITVLNEGAREIIPEDPDGSLFDMFACAHYWIVSSDAAEILARTSAQIDPESAFFYTNYDNSQTPLIDCLSDEGYVTVVPIDSMSTTNYPYTNFYLFPGAVFDDNDIHGVMLFKDEENVNVLARALLDQRGVEFAWIYADEATEGKGE